MALKSFASFDRATIAYQDEGEGSPVILLHGYGVDGLGQFGSFERILPLLEERQKLFIETFGAAPPLPDPPAEGRPGIIPPLLAANARVILPDLRGFGASAKSREITFYSNWAMARDVIALIEHLHLEAVDVVGFSMGAGTAARVVILGPPQVKSAILAGIADYAIEGTVLEFPKNWPVPEHLPKPLTHKIWAEEGARVLEKNELVPGNLASAQRFSGLESLRACIILLVICVQPGTGIGCLTMEARTAPIAVVAKIFAQSALFLERIPFMSRSRTMTRCPAESVRRHPR